MTRYHEFLANVINKIVNPGIELLFALAVLYFLWGMFEFLLSQSNQERKTTGKSHMLWGVVGIAIMMSVLGIMKILLNTLEIPPNEINVDTGAVHLTPYNPPTPKFNE